MSDVVHTMALRSGVATYPDQYALVWCPACDRPHRMGVGEQIAPDRRWEWNRDRVRPVFSPSLLMRGQVWYPPVTPENIERYRQAPWPQEQRPDVCHSYIGCNGAQPGEITFLADCTHSLAGQTVPLPAYPAVWK